MSLYVKIEKSFKDFKLETEFETAKGILGILGASGSGKSMTLKCIAGILTPDRGKIVLNGRTLFDSEKGIHVKPQKRRVGYLFQDYALFPNKTVAGNISCAMEKGKREEVGKWIRLFRLEGLENQYPSQLSGGQKQRTALARMLASEPELLLLDEPFSALDSHLKEQLQLELLELLEGLKKDTLLVTHSRDEAYRLCPKLMIMDKGRTVCKGRTKELFENPEYLEAARLTGCKNFSRVEKIDDFHGKAVDWGVVFETERPLEAEETWVGIRAHYFQPGKAGEGETGFFPVLEEAVESPFEMYIIFRCQEPVSEYSHIWWKVSKERWYGALRETMPFSLKIKNEDLMLLRQGSR